MNNIPSPSSNNFNLPKEKNTLVAFLGYILFIIPLLSNAKDDPFVRYHTKQSLGLFVFYLILFLLKSTIGKVVEIYFLLVILGILLFIFWCLGVVNVFLGKEKPVPIIGKFMEKLPF